MSIFRKQLPEGVQDFLPQECRLKRSIEATLRCEFERNGYEEVETPTFEYYDVFTHGIGAYMQENMIKFFDLKGKIMVLRPDLTVPITRLASYAYPKQKSLRLCYIQNAFGVNDYNIGQRGEYTQAGIECIGENGSETDAEVIALAIKCMLKIGLTNFKLDIGHVGFFKGLIEEINLSSKDIGRIRDSIDAKNTVELAYHLSQAKIDEAGKDKFLTLPELFGDASVIQKAREMVKNSLSLKALDHLQAIITFLGDMGYEKYITIDLGMLHKLNYYSGVVFRGIVDGVGFPILSGGRYDDLYGEFGEKRPAVGFALGINRAMIALDKQGVGFPKKNVVTVVTSDKDAVGEAYAFAESLRESGKAVIFKIKISQREMEELNAQYPGFQLCHVKKGALSQWSVQEEVTCR